MKLNELKRLYESELPEDVLEWLKGCGYTGINCTWDGKLNFSGGDFECNTGDLEDGTFPFPLGNFSKDFTLFRQTSNDNKNLTAFNGPEKVYGTFSINCEYLGEDYRNGPKEVWGNFDVGLTVCHNLKSFEGSPRVVNGDYNAYVTDKITNLKGITKDISGDLFIVHTGGHIDLEGIADDIDHIGGFMRVNWDIVVKGGLGLLNIRGLKGLETGAMTAAQLPAPFKIINTHLANASESERKSGQRDIFACQQDLIDAGFDDFAVL